MVACLGASKQGVPVAFPPPGCNSSRLQPPSRDYPPRVSSMIAALTEGDRRGQVATSSRSAKSVQTGCRQPGANSTQVLTGESLCKTRASGAIPAAFRMTLRFKIEFILSSFVSNSQGGRLNPTKPADKTVCMDQRASRDSSRSALPASDLTYPNQVGRD